MGFINRIRMTLGKSNADADALAAMHADATVQVDDGPVISFRPAAGAPRAGIVFYQGGRCAAEGYAPVMRALAAAGYAVFIPRMPARLAVLGKNKAAGVIADQPDIATWFIGGHSMGGAMAAAFAHDHHAQLAGLFLIGSYAAEAHALPDAALPVLVLSASRDEIVRQTELDAQAERLPAHTRFEEIAGGDHFRFASFAGKPVAATISREEQQRRTVDILLDFLAAATG